jgi:hypothetical protein
MQRKTHSLVGKPVKRNDNIVKQLHAIVRIRSLYFQLLGRLFIEKKVIRASDKISCTFVFRFIIKSLEVVFLSKKSLQVEDIQVSQFGADNLYSVRKFCRLGNWIHRGFNWFILFLRKIWRMRTETNLGPICLYKCVFVDMSHKIL